MSRLSGSALWFVVVRSSRMGVQFFAIFVLVRFYSPEWAGAMTLALAITAPVFIVCDLGLRTLATTIVGGVHYARILGIRAVTTLLALGLCLVGAGIPGPIGVMIPVMAVVKASDSFVELSLAPEQFRGRLARIGILVLASYGTAAVSLPMLAARASPSVALWLGLALPTCLMAAVATAFGITSSRSVPSLQVRGASLKAVLYAGAALGLSSGVFALGAGIPQYVLAWANSTVSAGRYAAIMYPVLGVEVILNAAMHAWVPRGVKARTKVGPDNFQRELDSQSIRLSILFLPFATACTAVTHWALPVFLGPTYVVTPAELLFVWLILCFEPALFLGATALQIQNLYGLSLETSVASAVTVGVISVFAVPTLGVLGALFATLVGVVVRILFMRVAARRSEASAS